MSHRILAVALAVLMISFATPPIAFDAQKEDCLSYNPNNLSIITLRKKGKTSYTVRDGEHWITNYPTFTDAYAAMAYMRNFNTICFQGRGTSNIRFWFEKR